MRTTLTVTLDVDVAADLRARATECGAHLGELVQLCVKVTLARLTPEQLTRWAGGLKSRAGRPATTRTHHERLVHAEMRGGLGLSHTQLARATGLLLREAQDALVGLERGGAVFGVRSSDLDRWGRPVESVWWPAGQVPDVDPAGVMTALRALRAELARVKLDPTAHGVLEMRLRRTTRWSDGALALPPAREVGPYDVVGPAYLPWLRERWPFDLGSDA